MDTKEDCSSQEHQQLVMGQDNDPADPTLTQHPRPRRFDPFQIFEVTHKKCHILHVHVVSGKDVTKGWLNDLVDTPDPYLVLSVPGTPNGRKKTRAIDNCVSPVWDERFQFLLDPSDIHQLELVLMDANYTLDEEMGREFVPLDTLNVGHEIEKTVAFPNGSKILLKLLVNEDENPDLRYSLALSEDEKEFLKHRRLHVMAAIKKLLGQDIEASNIIPKEVPVIGLLGSGGGFRAMTALNGVMHALHEEGILDCVMYMAGLSGSSWYLSYLYSHPDFPEKPPGYFHEELRDAIGRNWMHHLTPAGVLRYSRAILAKASGGQPVSFTDLFGHLVADTLLGPTRKMTTLSDQRRTLVNGASPLPLYTCLNVKKNVSARVFQDWVEFSPYEIGFAKYGLFMKPELFNSKLYVGKLNKKFPECPLHFLQGIWGSAFCILFKRLIKERGNNKNKDLAEMIRDSAIKEEETETLNRIGDNFIAGEDEAEDHFLTGSSDDHMEGNSSDESSSASISPHHSQDLPGYNNTVQPNSKGSETSQPSKDKSTKAIRRLKREVAFEDSDTDDGEDKNKRAERKSRGNSAWKERRQTKKKEMKEKHQSFWQSAIDSLFNSSIMDTRAGRAGLVFNPLRGLNLKTTFPVSPFSPTTAEDDVDFKGFYEALEIRSKKLFLVDSGLTFNIPFPLLLRPQRAVDLYLSFDFSGRETDQTPPFKEVLLAEQWARLNQVPFPPVDTLVEKYKKEPTREWYLFEDTTDPYCPIILHFVIFNGQFRNFKAPGVPRETPEEKAFADFDIFSDPETPYSIYNFHYTEQQFERMSKLMEFNVRLGAPEIRQQVARAVRRKRSLLPKPPVALSEVPKLQDKVKSKSILHKFKEYVRSMSLQSFSDDDLKAAARNSDEDEQQHNGSNSDKNEQQEQNESDEEEDDFQDAEG